MSQLLHGVWSQRVYFALGWTRSNATSTTALKGTQDCRASPFPLLSRGSQISTAVLVVRIFVEVPADARM